jgi:hypothetical protein
VKVWQRWDRWEAVVATAVFVVFDDPELLRRTMFAAIDVHALRWGEIIDGEPSELRVSLSRASAAASPLVATSPASSAWTCRWTDRSSLVRGQRAT